MQDSPVIKAIRKRQYMYLPPELPSADSAMSALWDQLLYFDVGETRIDWLDAYTVIRSQRDWIASATEKEAVFSTLMTHPKFPPNSMRAEILFPAFKLRYHSTGTQGSVGDESLQTDLLQKSKLFECGDWGRIFICLRIDAGRT